MHQSFIRKKTLVKFYVKKKKRTYYNMNLRTGGGFYPHGHIKYKIYELVAVDGHYSDADDGDDGDDYA